MASFISFCFIVLSVALPAWADDIEVPDLVIEDYDSANAIKCIDPIQTFDNECVQKHVAESCLSKARYELFARDYLKRNRKAVLDFAQAIRQSPTYENLYKQIAQDNNALWDENVVPNKVYLDKSRRDVRLKKEQSLLGQLNNENILSPLRYVMRRENYPGCKSGKSTIESGQFTGSAAYEPGQLSFGCRWAGTNAVRARVAPIKHVFEDTTGTTQVRWMAEVCTEIENTDTDKLPPRMSFCSRADIENSSMVIKGRTATMRTSKMDRYQEDAPLVFDYSPVDAGSLAKMNEKDRARYDQFQQAIEIYRRTHARHSQTISPKAFEEELNAYLRLLAEKACGVTSVSTTAKDPKVETTLVQPDKTKDKAKAVEKGDGVKLEIEVINTK